MCYEYTVKVVEQVVTEYRITAPTADDAWRGVQMRGKVISETRGVEDAEPRLTEASLIELGKKYFPDATTEQIKMIIDLSNHDLETLLEEDEAIYHFEYIKDLHGDNFWLCECGNEYATGSNPLEHPGVCVECI